MIDYNADKVITPISTDRTVFRGVRSINVDKKMTALEQNTSPERAISGFPGKG
ncbi:hypothetical protein LNP24_00835 [Klebsiella pneumoniae subsp. pneumoniae]|nr:hypothetical protein [Klebsiella pneumoniae subsp. pneumoniae]